MIEPCGYRVLVKPFSITEIDPAMRKAKQSGLIIPEDHEEIRRQQNAVDRGIVKKIGPVAFSELGKNIEVGDEVVFAKYAGKILEDTDGEKYIILNDEDIVARIK